MGVHGAVFSYTKLLPIYQNTRCHHTKEIARSTGRCFQQTNYPIFTSSITKFLNRDNSFSITTRYGLDSTRIEFQWGRNFLHLSRPALESIYPSVQWVPEFFPGGKATRCVALKIYSYLASRLKTDCIFNSTFPLGQSWPVLA